MTTPLPDTLPARPVADEPGVYRVTWHDSAFPSLQQEDVTATSAAHAAWKVALALGGRFAEFISAERVK